MAGEQKAPFTARQQPDVDPVSQSARLPQTVIRADRWGGHAVMVIWVERFETPAILNIGIITNIFACFEIQQADIFVGRLLYDLRPGRPCSGCLQ